MGLLVNDNDISIIREIPGVIAALCQELGTRTKYISYYTTASKKKKKENPIQEEKGSQTVWMQHSGSLRNRHSAWSPVPNDPSPRAWLSFLHPHLRGVALTSGELAAGSRECAE